MKKRKFMLAEGRWLLNGIEIFWCQYDIKHYHLDLFDHLEIYCPPNIKKSVNKRQAEFLAGRAVAARALSYHGIKGYDICTGVHRAPIWPTGIVGSIAHTHEYAVSAALPCAVCHYLGLDIEVPISSQVAGNIYKMVINDRETALIAKFSVPANMLFTLFFSAKESLFKAIYPSINHYLDFDSSEVIECNIKENYLLLSISDLIAKKMNNQKVFLCHFNMCVSQLLTLVSGYHT